MQDGYKLVKFGLKQEVGKNQLMNEVDERNKLSRYVINTKPIESFKWRLDRYMDGEGGW